MLKILINSFKREFELKNSISYVYLYLTYYSSSFASLNKVYLLSVYKSNIGYLLSKLIVSNFDVNKQLYLSSRTDLADLNKFVSTLERVLSSKTP